MGGGYFNKLLTKDVKEINKVFLSLFSTGIILIATFVGINITKSSYALFSDNVISSNTIEVEVTNNEPNHPLLDENMIPVYYDETNEAVLIDCGCMEKEEERELSEFIADNHLVLKRYLCTHLHLDHIFGNEFVYKTYGLSPEAHKADVEMLPSPEKQAVLFGIPQRINTVSVKKFLSGGEIVRFGNAELEVLTVPGHSPGSVAFYNKENGFIIVGDVLFAGSIGRSDLWGGNHDILLAAINDKLLSLPDETIVYPGHGAATTIYDEKMNNPYLIDNY